MMLNSFTLDIDPSSPESNSDDTEDEDSVNEIVELSNSNDVEDTVNDIVDATDFIIPTQNCIVVPPTPVTFESDPSAASISAPDPIDLTTDLQAIAIKIKKREESCAITDAERKIIDESTRHEKGYGASICRIEKRFFETIDKFGTDSLKRLLILEDDGLKCELLFYVKLRGECTIAKQVSLNKCLTYCAIK